MRKTTAPNRGNMLKDIYARLMAFPTVFRDQLGEECRWSTPTFYRKQKDSCFLSNAEMEKIIAVFDEKFQDLWDYCEKYRNRRR